MIFDEQTTPTLVEPGVKYFIRETLKKCNGYNTSLISTNDITCIINTVIKFQRKCKLQSNYK